MAQSMTGARTGAQPGAASEKKRSVPAVLLVLLTILAVGAFYLGAQYYTAKRSVTFNAVAVSMDEEGITLYRPPSGVLEPFLKDDDGSLLVKVPLAPRYSVKDSAGKGVKPDAFRVSEDAPKALELTVNPQGKVCRIRELPGFFSIEGPVTVKSQGEIEVAGKTVFSRLGTLLLDFGVPTGMGGEEPASFLETGDTVSVMGFESEALTVNRIGRAGYLSVTASVAGARVYVDGALRGKAPLEVSCAPGERELLVRADGYRDHRGTVQVSPDAYSSYHAVLEEITGTLVANTTPQGATVYVDGEVRGTTPARIPVKPGRHEVTFELEGYYPKTAEVVVPADYEQPVSAVLAKMAGSQGGGAGGGTAPTTDARTVTVLSVSPETMTFTGLYPAGYEDTFRVTTSTTMDGWPVSKSTLERLLPGEEVRVVLSTDGSVASMSKTSSHSFTQRGQVMGKSGRQLFIGDRWVECSLAWNAIVQDAQGNRWAREISPGDTVAVYGTSASDIRFVRVEDTLGETTAVEGHLVSTPQGLRLFGDSRIMSIHIPSALRVSDVEGRTTLSLSGIPSGSRVRFLLSAKQETVWAEIVWKANASVQGPVSAYGGDVLRVGASWEDLKVNMWAVVYNGTTRTSYQTISLGDYVLAAGPSADDIRFVWIQNDAQNVRVVDAVVMTVPGRQDKALFEVTPSGLSSHPFYLSSGATVGYPSAQKTIKASNLEPGDRLRLWVNSLREIVWAEVTDKVDFSATGTYLGVYRSYTYLSGMRRYSIRSDLIVTGLAEGHYPEPGSTVRVSGTGGVITFMEVLSDRRPDRTVKGTVISTKGALTIRGNWYWEEVPYEKDAWFVDWELMVDGPVPSLFPGDVVTVHVDIADKVVLVERTYSPPFKLEGTIEARQGRTLIVSDKSGKHTVELSSSVRIYKSGVQGTLYDLRPGDKVYLSGTGKGSIDVVSATESRR
ncbi:MAG TPA: PEGA domain-containing protein [Firmicutes bacterium]|nr:PEGA domain-containing protein [Candidatus Fermentithermobacillaceae bacterium]